MQSATQITDNLRANLQDPRTHGICLFIERLVKRQKPEIGLPVYRIIDRTTGLEVKTVDEFIAALDPATLDQSYPYGGERLSGDRVTGYELVVENLEVRFNIYSDEDLQFSDHSNFFGDFGSIYRFCFYMAYMNDMDTDLQVKISSVRLITW